MNLHHQFFFETVAFSTIVTISQSLSERFHHRAHTAHKAQTFRIEMTMFIFYAQNVCPQTTPASNFVPTYCSGLHCAPNKLFYLRHNKLYKSSSSVFLHVVAFYRLNIIAS